MGIATYQIQNILRVYNKQLRFEKIAPKDNREQLQVPSDEVSISDEAKKAQILKQVRSQAVQQVMAKVSKLEGAEDVPRDAEEKGENHLSDGVGGDVQVDE